MKIVNNNMAFQSGPVQQNLELVASMNDRDIKKASVAMAHQDYRKKSEVTKPIALGIFLGLPVADSIANAAMDSTHMSSSVKSGFKTLVRYGVYFALAMSFLGLSHKISKDSDSVGKFKKEHPGSYIVAELAGMIAGTTATLAILKRPANYILNKLDKDAKVRKAVGEQINRLDGGFIHRGLRKTGELLTKDVKSAKVGSILGAGVLLTVFGLLAKQVSDASKINSDVKRNEQYLRNLRSQSREILTVDDEFQTTRNLLELELEECNDLDNIKSNKKESE